MSSYNKKPTSSYFQKKKKSMAEKVRDASSDYFGKAKSPKTSKVVTKKMLKDSGFDNLRDYLNAERGLTRRKDSKPKKDAPKTNVNQSKPSRRVTLQDVEKFAGSKSKVNKSASKPNTSRNQTPVQMANSMGLTGVERVNFLNKEGIKRKSMRPSKPRFKAGGKVNKMDGIAVRGKTKGKIV